MSEVKPKLAYGKRTELLRELLKTTGFEISHKDFREKWKEQNPDIKPPSRSYFDEIVQKEKAKTDTPAETVTETPAETVTETTTEPTEQEIKEAEKLTGMKLPELQKGILTGKIKKEHIAALWKVESKLLKQAVDFEHDPETIDALAAIWELPIEMFLSTITSKDTDKVLLMAVAVTLIAHAPLIPKLLGKLKRKPKNEAQ